MHTEREKTLGLDNQKELRACNEIDIKKIIEWRNEFLMKRIAMWYRSMLSILLNVTFCEKR